MMRIVLPVLVLTVLNLSAQAQEQITLTAKDGLTVTADVYRAHTAKDVTWIVLAHQAQASRGEYRTIAPRLNKLGFNAIALDQRSGKGFAGIPNKTAALAKRKGKARSYLAAIPDIVAGITWARQQTSGRVIIFGSSYSSSSALLLAGEQPKLVDGVVSNSPGEYLRGRSIRKVAPRIAVPVLITSPANERRQWRKIFDAIGDKRKVGFAPAKGGRHGSSALIASRNTSSKAYWEVLEGFLRENFQ